MRINKNVGSKNTHFKYSKLSIPFTFSFIFPFTLSILSFFWKLNLIGENFIMSLCHILRLTVFIANSTDHLFYKCFLQSTVPIFFANSFSSNYVRQKNGLMIDNFQFFIIFEKSSSLFDGVLPNSPSGRCVIFFWQIHISVTSSFLLKR